MTGHCTRHIFLFLFVFTSLTGQAQEEFWVLFRDKKGVDFNPYEYFDPATIEHRTRLNLPLYDVTDLPVNPQYIDSVGKLAASTGFASRWLNALWIKADHRQKEGILALRFVKSVQPVSSFSRPLYEKPDTLLRGTDDYLLHFQIESMGAALFRQQGLDGSDIRIAVFDGGFPGVDTSPVFAHLRQQGKIVKTWDFVRNREEVYGHLSHGTMVLSCIAGKLGDRCMGMAPEAEFLLAITEQHGEPFSEEKNWLAAMEWADRNGAQLINSSLGYTDNRYFEKDMNGKTSLVAQAARIAARKGILVINAIGNDGQKRWEILSTPADVDSVLSVGGIDPITGYHISFSSYGPTANGLRKPNVSAPGKAVVEGRRMIQASYGTSFSTPLVTGFTACVLQRYPGMSNMDLLHAVERSGHLYPYFDYAHGYGLPQASAILANDTLPVRASFTFRIGEENIYVAVNDSIQVESSRYQDKYMYYHLADRNNKLIKYGVSFVYDHEPLHFPLKQKENVYVLRVWYKGYTGEYYFTHQEKL